MNNKLLASEALAAIIATGSPPAQAAIVFSGVSC